MSLKNMDDFLMHGVVLQNRVSRPGPARPMFHVKHPCAKRTILPSAEGRDVSRETIFSDASHPFTAPISSPRVM
jgi:hypothetical protein